MRLPPNPQLSWKDDGTPVAADMDDIYFSRDDGLEEARVVFLEGTGLPARWRGRERFTVAELGFGTGLNFLALWQMWARTREKDGWLDFVSFEGLPLEAEDAARALQAWPDIALLVQKLIAKWPDRAKGVREIIWPEDRIRLVLHVGDISETLPQAMFAADAWFLDGFSPAKNGAMWADRLWPMLAERSAPDARIGTFTVAGAVRRGLQAAGFEVEKKPGHGRKRQRLEAALGGVTEQHGTPGKIAIIGAGIAGAALGFRLQREGVQPTLFDGAAGPAEGTSGNPLALAMPRLDAGDTVEARLLVDAYLSARGFYQGVPGAEFTDVSHRPKDEAEATRFEKVLADPPLGLKLLEATARGVLHKGALLLRPPDVLKAMLGKLDVRWGRSAQVDVAERTVNGEAFDAIVLATGWSMAETLPWLRLQGRAGQVEYYESKIAAPPSAVASGHYALASGTLRLWGASFEAVGADGPIASELARQGNIAALSGLAPYWAAEARQAVLRSRTGVRATTPDRLPLIGGLPDVEATLETFSGLRRGRAVEADMPVVPGVYICGGFGSRGFTWAPYAAGIISSALLGSAVPARAEALSAIDPARQLIRDLKRGRI